jgi:hypothetical protein
LELEYCERTFICGYQFQQGDIGYSCWYGMWYRFCHVLFSIYRDKDRFHNEWEVNIASYLLGLFNFKIIANKPLACFFFINLKLNKKSWYEATFNSHELWNLFLLWFLWIICLYVTLCLYFNSYIVDVIILIVTSCL